MLTEIYESGFRVPVKAWLPKEEIEPGALDQLRDAATHPESALHVAVMPDCHVGMGVTIGSVLPTVGSVLPNAVGVDIGCGMCAVDTGIALDAERMDRRFWRGWAEGVRKAVPTGFNWHKKPQVWEGLDTKLQAVSLQHLMREKAAVQLGTLGGGNHFLEAQIDERGAIWLMVHSGSRHTGLRIADHYDELARKSTSRRRIGAPKFLPSLRIDEPDGEDYLHDMAWATDFALESRKRMIDAMVASLERALDDDVPVQQFINIHHNFAQLEEHDGEQVIVHRKGATSARDGQLGIIPGSMGSPSYIVRGLGNAESHNSCSHGAGRRMSRTVAKKQISEEVFEASIAGTHSTASRAYLDEAPAAYKDIDVVINRQRDLIDIVHTLKPIITVKGDSKAKED